MVKLEFKSEEILMSSNSAQIEATCPICSAQCASQVFRAKSPEKSGLITFTASGYSRGGRDLFKCMNCKLIFCSPLPDPRRLSDSYDQGEDFDFISQNHSRISTFAKALKKINPEIRSRVCEEVVDVGTASGAFLVALRQHGGRGLGIEPNGWLVEHARTVYNVNVVKGDTAFLETLESAIRTVSMWDVLEHLPNPKEVADLLQRKIACGGHLLLSLPDTGSMSFKLLKFSWPMHLDVHLLYYNKSSLNALLVPRGFQLVESRKYTQELSLGYILLRALRMTSDIPKEKALYKVLMSGLMQKVTIRYSIGQRFYLYKKV